MDIFTTGIIVLFAATAVFYIVFFGFMYYWHQKKITYVVVPALFTFDFFVIGFFIICITSIILNYLPDLVRILGQ